MDSEVELESEFEGMESFPEEIQSDANALEWLGYIEESFEFAGHRFMLRTLYGEEELLAGLISKRYMETIGQHKAYAWALVALALTAVDDDPDFCPQVSPDPEAYAKGRFQYVTRSWLWPVGQFLYKSYAILLQRQADAVEAMENLSNGSLHTSMPFAGSSTDKGNLAEVGEELKDLVDMESEPQTPSESAFSDS